MSPHITKLIFAPIVGVALCCAMLSGCGSGGSDDVKTTVIEKDGDETLQSDTPKMNEDIKNPPRTTIGTPGAKGSTPAPATPSK